MPPYTDRYESNVAEIVRTKNTLPTLVFTVISEIIKCRVVSRGVC